MLQATKEQAQLLSDLFIGRQDDYAVQTSIGRYRRIGLPVSIPLLQDHLTGSCTIGTYLIDEQGNCFFAVFDADQDQGLALLAEVKRRLASEGIPSYLEQSRRGGHLWVFLDTPAPAWAVRQWLLPFCPPNVEFYPKQDETSGYGSLIRVPLGVHRRSGQRYPFLVCKQDTLVPIASDVAHTLAALQHVRRAPVPQALFTAYRHAHQGQVSTHQSKAFPSPIRSLSVTPTIADWCAQQDPFLTIGKYVTLDSRGMGCCPLGDHHSDGKDTHPSFRVFEPRQRGGNCWCCYAGGISGDVFNFLQLYHKLSASELWSWIRTGQVR